MTQDIKITTYELDYDAFDEPSPLCVHLVTTSDTTILFGTGHTSTADEVLDICTEQAVDVVVPEHGDIDHFGGIPFIRQQLESPPTIAIPEGDSEKVADEGVQFDQMLSEGPTPWGFQTISVPGHTSGNMAFLINDVLIAGDTVLGSDFGPVSMDDWSGDFAIAPPSRNAGGDKEAQRSVRKLLDYDFEQVLVTHGSSVRSGAYTDIEKLVEDLENGIERTDF